MKLTTPSHLSNDMGPEYVREDPLKSKKDNSFHSVRCCLQEPTSRLKSYIDCAFGVAFPILWNKLSAGD